MSGEARQAGTAQQRRAFVQAAETLIGDPELRQELARRGRAYAETAFDIDAVASRFEEVLERARRSAG